MKKSLILIFSVAVTVSILAVSVYALEYTSAGLRDPFAVSPKFKKLFKEEQKALTVSPGSFTLTGIVFKGPRLRAIINEKVVGIGETVDGAKVVEIKKDGVKLSADGQEFIIKITEKQ